LVCSVCLKSDSIKHDQKNGRMVCFDCGLIVEERVISDEAEWRSFEQDKSSDKQDRSRVGGPDDTLLGEQLGTIIGADPNDPNMPRYNRGMLQSSEDRSLLHAFGAISRLAARLSMPKVIVDRAKELYKKVVETDEFKVRKTEVVVTTCVYVACRQNGVDRTIKELCAVADVRRREVGRCFSKIKQLKVYKQLNSAVKRQIQMPSSANLVDRFCSHLKLPAPVATAARHICEKISELGVAAGRNPATLAGAAIYLASQLHPMEKRSYNDISVVSRMTASTLRLSYKKLWEHRADLVPEPYASKEAIEALPKA